MRHKCVAHVLCHTVRHKCVAHTSYATRRAGDVNYLHNLLNYFRALADALELEDGDGDGEALLGACVGRCPTQ